jgi:hypothetical protein
MTDQAWSAASERASSRSLRAERHCRYLPGAAIALVAGFAGWVTTSSLQQDFAAYWVAGTARRLGLDPYVNQVGGVAAPNLWDGVAVFAHSRFLYPPVVAEVFRPFALLPYPLAKAVFTALMVGSWIAASFTLARASATPRAAALTFGAGALFYPLYLALERGQIEPLVLLLLIAAFRARARPAAAGAALAAVVAFKPALGGVVLVVAALGRWRVVGAALAGLAVIALAGVALSGPALTVRYVTRVLPRAALYGEGGDEGMLLTAARLASRSDELEAGVASLDGRSYPVAAWEGPASASLPRLLAPSGPTRLATRAPAILLLALLVAAARGARRRDGDTGEELLFWAAAVACVIASPAGWVMGLVVALPLVPARARLRGGAGPARVLRRGLGLALLACACPPPFAGWAAVSGVGVVGLAVGLAGASRRGRERAPSAAAPS